MHREEHVAQQGKDWSDVSPGPGMPRIARNDQKSRKRGTSNNSFSLQASRRNPSIPHLEIRLPVPPNRGPDKFLLFQPTSVLQPHPWETNTDRLTWGALSLSVLPHTWWLGLPQCQGLQWGWPHLRGVCRSSTSLPRPHCKVISDGKGVKAQLCSRMVISNSLILVSFSHGDPVVHWKTQPLSVEVLLQAFHLLFDFWGFLLGVGVLYLLYILVLYQGIYTATISATSGASLFIFLRVFLVDGFSSFLFWWCLLTFFPPIFSFAISAFWILSKKSLPTLRL